AIGIFSADIRFTSVADVDYLPPLARIKFTSLATEALEVTRLPLKLRAEAEVSGVVVEHREAASSFPRGLVELWDSEDEDRGPLCLSAVPDAKMRKLELPQHNRLPGVCVAARPGGDAL